jgi:PAS domain S-box-containing protein
MSQTRKNSPSLLLIDDDPVFRRLMVLMFTQEGFNVQSANDAESALELLNQRMFHVAIVDYKLPDQTGVDFFERTRRTHPSMIRVLLTAHTTEEVLYDSINRGEVYRYLTKPVHMGLLLSTVEQALALHELTSTRASLILEMENRTKELQEKNEDLRNYYHLMGELKAQQDQILASLPEPFMLLRADRRIIKCNQAAVDMLGFSRGELLGKMADDLFLNASELAERIGDVGRNGVGYFESEWHRRSGATISVKIALNKFQGESVEQNQVALVVQDITSVKQLENLQRDRSQQLERTVEDQILQIVRQQRALAHSEKLASLGTLVAGAAHEINTSGSLIKTNLEVLQQYWNGLGPIIRNWAVENPDTRIGNQAIGRVLSDIESLLEDLGIGAVQLSRIVNGMLAFSRKDVRIKELFNLEEALDAALTITKARREGCFYVRRRVCQTSKLVYGNRGQIVQVLVALIMNACDAWDDVGKAGKGRMTFFIRSAREGGRMVVSLSDTAGGMPVDVAAHVFDPFFTTKKGKGTGLGLSICHGIVSEHGGDIWVRVRPGKGSIFSFSIPTPVAG